MIEMRRRWEKLTESEITVSGSVSVGVHPVTPPKVVAVDENAERQKIAEKDKQKEEQVARERLEEAERTIRAKLVEIENLERKKSQANADLRDMEQKLERRREGILGDIKNLEKQKTTVEVEIRAVEKQLQILSDNKKEAELWEKELRISPLPSKASASSSSSGYFSVVVFAAGLCVGAIATFYYGRV